VSEGESPVERTAPEAEAGPVALSRLIDEIRADRRWREEVAALRSGSAGSERQASPAADSRPDANLDALDEAIVAADREVPIEPGRPVIGEAWARVRRQIHGEIRIYQDRQTAANQLIAAALRRLDARLAAADALAAEIEPIGALRLAVEELEARLTEVERWRANG